MRKMKGMKSWLMHIVVFLAGVMLSNTVKPMLSKLPFIGGLMGGSTTPSDDEYEDETQG